MRDQIPKVKKKTSKFALLQTRGSVGTEVAQMHG